MPVREFAAAAEQVYCRQYFGHFLLPPDNALSRGWLGVYAERCVALIAWR